VGFLIAIAVIAPVLGGAAVLDWRSRKRRKKVRRSHGAHTTARRDVDLGLDIGGDG
jgi:hypothetical protein